MIITTAIIAAVSAFAGAIAEDWLLLREQTKQGFVRILGKPYHIDTPMSKEQMAALLNCHLPQITPLSPAKPPIANDLRCNACGVKYQFDDLSPVADGKQLYLTLLQCKTCGGQLFTKLEVAQ